MNNSHRGQIVQKVLKSNHCNIAKLALDLKMSRGTIYKYFREENLRSDFIIKVGKIIRYDFLKDIPDLLDDTNRISGYDGVDEDHEMYTSKLKKELVAVQKKYYTMLEEHIDLVHFLGRVATNPDLASMQKEARELIEKKNLLRDEYKKVNKEQ